MLCRPLLRAVVVLVSLCLLGVSSMAGSWADGEVAPASSDPGSDPGAQAAAEPGGSLDVPELRTRFSRAFEAEGGGVEREIFAVPVNYRVGGGWAPVESSLVDSERLGFVVENGANAFDLLLPADAGSHPVRVEEDGSWVSFAMAGADGAPEVAGEEASYAGPEGTELRLQSTPVGVKETVVLDEAPAGPAEYVYEVKASAGLTPALAGDGGVEFTTGDGVVEYAIPAPFMVDSSGTEEGTSTAVRLGLSETSAGWRLTMTADAGWLADPARVYPVMIDPTVSTLPDASTDCWINQASTGTNYCDTNVLRVGLDANAKKRRTLVKFPVTSIPASATVTSAKLGLYADSTQTRTTKTASYVARRVDQSWNSNATWTARNATANWSTAGGSWAGSTAGLNLAPATDGYRNFEVTPYVADWVSGAQPNYGVIIKQSAEDVDNSLGFYTSEDPAAAKRPKLVVTYNTAPSVPANLGLSPCLQTCSPMVSETATPTLAATSTDADLDDLTYQFQVYAAGGSTALASGLSPSTPQGQPGSWQVPAGTLTDNGSYEFRVRASDGDIDGDGTLDYSAYSARQAFTVDIDLAPAAPTGLQVAPCLGDCDPVLTDTLNPALSAVAGTDADTTTVHVDFEVREAGSTQLLTTGSSNPVASGSRGTFTVPTGVLADHGDYEFRAGTRDDRATTWSGWQAFSVDLDEVPAAPTGFSVAPCEGDCSTWTTRSTTPTISVISSDADSDTLDYDFELREAGTTTTKATGSDDTVPAGSSARWLIPIGTLAAGTYEVRARASDKTSTGTWAEWSTFTVDAPAPGPGTVVNATTIGDDNPATPEQNVVWTPENSPYRLSSGVTIKAGGTLTIEPGTVVKAFGGSITVNGGRVEAHGSANFPVVFTSKRDDSVLGDSDGAFGAPAPGDYGTILSIVESTDGGSVLDNVALRYGAIGSGDCRAYQAIRVEAGGALSVSNSEFKFNDHAAIRTLPGSHTVIRNSNFSDNNECSVAYEGPVEVYDSVFGTGGGLFTAFGSPEGGVIAEGNYFYSYLVFWFWKPTGEQAKFRNNAILGGTTNTTSGKNLDLRENWWGHPVGPAPVGSCQTTQSYPYWDWGSSQKCIGVWREVFGYFTQVLPAMAEPPPFPVAGLEGARATPQGTPVEQQFGQGGEFGSRASGVQADPVNSATGSYVDAEVDAALPAVGVPLVAERTYNSADTSSGLLGTGWSSGFDTSLSVVPGQSATLRSGDGQRLNFSHVQGAWKPADGVTATLVDAGAGYEVTTRAGMVYQFDANGRLTSAKDRNGEGLTYTRDGNGRLTTVSGSGRQLTLGYNGSGLLASVTLADGRHVDYGYTNGRLTSVRNLAGKTTSYGYDTQGRLETETNPLNKQVMRLAYNPATGRVSDQWDALNHHTVFAWDPATERATMTDPRGGAWVDDYDHGVIASRTDPVGRTTRYGYDTQLRLTSVENPNGTLSHYSYNAAGDMTAARTPFGRVTTDYNNRHDPTRAVSARGVTTEFTYDPNGNPASVTRTTPTSEVVTESATYNARGLLSTATDARGKTTTYDYNTHGDLISETSPAGRVTSYGLEPATGRLESVTDPRGNLAGANPEDYRTHYTWTNDDQVDTVTDPLDGLTNTDYDNAGQVTTVTDPKDRTTGYTYDDAGQVLTVQGPDPTVPAVEYGYDANGQVTTVTDEADRTVAYTYTKAGQVATTTVPGLGTATLSYDGVGNLAKVTDGTGLTTGFSYNAQSLPTKVDYPAGTADVTYGYDTQGNRTSMTDGAGTVAYTFDYLDRLKTVTRGSQSFTYGYNATGLITSIDAPAGISHAYTYDDDGLLDLVKDGTGAVLADYDYNPAGLPTGAAMADGSAWTRTYDPLGQVSSIHDVAADDTVLLDQTITRDPVGNPTRIVEDGQTNTYTYDAFDQLTGVCYDTTDCTGAADYIKWTYGPAGNRKTETRPTGTDTYNYDPATGWLDTITGPTGTRTFDYDTHGRLTTDGTTSYTYNAANQVTSETTGGATATYGYDGEGRRLTATTAASTTKYLWDPLSYQLTAETDATGTLLRSYHQGLGTFGFRTPGQGDSVHHLDVQNSVRAVTGPDGSVDETTSYEPFGSVLDHTVTDPQAPGSGLGWAGEQADDSGNIHLRARQYDPTIGLFTAPDPVASTSSSTTHSYANNNPMVYADPSGLFSLTGAITSGLAWVNDHSTAVTVVSTALTFTPLAPLGYAGLGLTAISSAYNAYDTCTNGPKGACAGAVTDAAIDAVTSVAFGGLARGAVGAFRGLAPAARFGDDLAQTAARYCSFSGATTVLMADGTKKPIEDIQVGDKVIATDPETGEQKAKKVTHVWVHNDTVTDLALADGETLTTTENHPFWSVTDQTFERADQLAEGELVLASDGNAIAVSGLKLGTETQALAFNLTVQGIHTYHVGDAEALVHNSCRPPIRIPAGSKRSADRQADSWKKRLEQQGYSCEIRGSCSTDYTHVDWERGAKSGTIHFGGPYRPGRR